MSDFEESMKAAEKQILSELWKRMENACLLIEGEARKECPVDQGFLRASITHSIREDGDKLIGTIGSNLEYAPYVHQGTGIYAVNGDGRKTPWGYVVKAGKYKGFHWTRGQKPNPFLARAVTKSRKAVEKRLGG